MRDQELGVASAQERRPQPEAGEGAKPSGVIRDRPDTPLLPSHYRGSLAIAAEDFLKHYIGGPLLHGCRRTEGWQSNRLIHRCTDIKTGAWVEVTPGERYTPHKLWAQGPAILKAEPSPPRQLEGEL